ncbi:hypothetical protein SUBVAR_06135 [Subdoligranulum variabile DSM 15176]|uniref:Uncharacterized protein n=1 Tax=Subdoligranulum variabile DSM 15176 TaxID=411471 RepID=D1PP21_9FIRM|nr:hypothetical protein SUBVAR_06135 [Subdoligranulum variabile DSM 15176]
MKKVQLYKKQAGIWTDDALFGPKFDRNTQKSRAFLGYFPLTMHAEYVIIITT